MTAKRYWEVGGLNNRKHTSSRGIESEVGDQNTSNNPFDVVHEDDGPPRWRFGLFSLMLAMLVFAVVGAAGNQLLRAVSQGTSPRAVFVMFTLIAPVMLVTVVSLARGLAVWLRSL